MDIVVILVIVLVIVAIWRGPKVLPEWGAAIGKTVREARTHATKGLDGDDDETKSLSEGSVGEPMAPSTTATSADTTGAPRPKPERSSQLMSGLPDNVRDLVAEIEREIGEDGFERLDEPGTDIESSARWAGTDTEGAEAVEAAVRQIIREIGEDPDRQGLVRTPERVHRMYQELTAGYHVDPERLVNEAIFDVDYSEMVLVKDIPFYSLCEHHLLPFFGTAAVAYIPRGRVLGLSKIPRIVEMYARRLQVQERLTQEVADFLMSRLEPRGVGVVMEATHLCAVMRGVRKPGTIMTTSAVLGLFRNNDKTRAEFFSHLARPAPGAP